MKNFLFLLIATLPACIAFGQNEKYMKTMEESVKVFDTTRSSEGLQDLANKFERIAEAEKTQWLPYYYAALCNVNLGYNHVFAAGPMGGNAEKGDPLADKADQLLSRAEELSKDNSEIFIVKKMIATLRMMGNVMARYMQYGQAAAEAMATAKKLNPDNPRVFLMEGLDLYNTPEQFGGSREQAKKTLEEAVRKFEAFQPETPIHPTWGLGAARHYLSLMQ